MPEELGQRREVRILCRINVLFRINSENFYGTCRNLGPNGMFIDFDGEVAVGDSVELSFMVAGTASSLVEAWGKVVWANCGSQYDPAVPEGFGVEFVGMTSESMQIVTKFIEQCSS